MSPKRWKLLGLGVTLLALLSLCVVFAAPISAAIGSVMDTALLGQSNAQAPCPGCALGHDAPVPTPTNTRHPSPTATLVPPTPTPRPAPTGWKTVLDDEFSNSGIPSHWALYENPYGSGPNNCAAPSQDSAPGDGYLYLTMAYKTSGACGAGWYTGGMMINDAYNLRQQAITIRWRIIPSAHPKIVFSHHIIPMIFPDDPNYQWYQGEDDLCETESYTDCWTFLHDGVAGDEGRQVYADHTVNLTKFHTWRFVQKAGKLTVYLDNLTTPIWTMTQGTSVLPDALRRAVLQQECPADACPPASYAGDIEQIQIDWITIQVPA